ncbi:MAG: hypothetical protein QOH44_1245 [Actinomycetota bacterium]|nr:hypothetical protein [Actinomycetota bacterium]
MTTTSVREGTLTRSGFRLWIYLSMGAAILGFVGSIVALVDTGIYEGLTAVFLPQALAQDLANLVVAPLLVIVAVLALRGSLRAYLAWLGVVAFTLYNYVIYAFSVPFGRLFPIWITVLSLSLFALIGGVHAIDAAVTANSYAKRRLVTTSAWVLLAVAGLFGLLWLSEDVPALLSGSIPQSVRDTALPTNPVHILDYVFFLPAAIITSIGLLCRRRFAFVAAPAFFVFLILTCAPILITPLVQVHVAINVGMIVAISVLALALLAVLILLVRSVHSQPQGMDRQKGRARVVGLLHHDEKPTIARWE